MLAPMLMGKISSCHRSALLVYSPKRKHLWQVKTKKGRAHGQGPSVLISSRPKIEKATITPRAFRFIGARLGDACLYRVDPDREKVGDAKVDDVNAVDVKAGRV